MSTKFEQFGTDQQWRPLANPEDLDLKPWQKLAPPSELEPEAPRTHTHDGTGEDSTVTGGVNESDPGKAIASGARSGAYSDYSQATGEESLAGGYQSDATANYATSWGAYSVASAERASAHGHFARATAANSGAYGATSLAEGLNSFAAGQGGWASKASATTVQGGAHGIEATAFGYGSRAGLNSTDVADYSTALGAQARVLTGHTHSTAVGNDVDTTKANQIMLGRSLEVVTHPGGVEFQVLPKTTTYTALRTDFYIPCSASGAAFTVTLPSATGTGQILWFKKTDSSGNSVTVSRAGSDLIDGATSKVLSAQYDFLIIQDRATNAWDILGATIGGSPPSTQSRALSVATKTTAYTLVSTDDVILGDATSAAFTLTLPAAASNTGRLFRIKKIDSSANAVTVDGNGAETIDDAATFVLSSQYDSISIVSDSSEWFIV